MVKTINEIVAENNIGKCYGELPEWKKEVLTKFMNGRCTNATIATYSLVSDKMKKRDMKALGLAAVYCYKRALVTINKSYRKAKAKALNYTAEQAATMELETRNWGSKVARHMVINNNRWKKDKAAGNRVEKLDDRIYLCGFATDCVLETRYFDQNGNELKEGVVADLWYETKPSFNSAVKDYREFNIDNIIGVKHGKIYGRMTL